jgi:hypothetical protein
MAIKTLSDRDIYHPATAAERRYTLAHSADLSGLRALKKFR